jgi:hypothetical protein
MLVDNTILNEKGGVLGGPWYYVNALKKLK